MIHSKIEATILDKIPKYLKLLPPGDGNSIGSGNLNITGGDGTLRNEPREGTTVLKTNPNQSYEPFGAP